MNKWHLWVDLRFMVGLGVMLEAFGFVYGWVCTVTGLALVVLSLPIAKYQLALLDQELVAQRKRFEEIVRRLKK